MNTKHVSKFSGSLAAIAAFTLLVGFFPTFFSVAASTVGLGIGAVLLLVALWNITK